MRASHWAPTLLFYAVLAAVGPSQALAYSEDDGTQMNISGVGDVHICANNEPMVGLDAAHNRFLCSKAVTVGPQGTWIADTSTHQTFTFNGAPVSIHVCPPGEVMMGLSCPSSDDLRQFGCFWKGGSGSSVVEIKRHAGDAANDDLRWSGV